LSELAIPRCRKVNWPRCHSGQLAKFAAETGVVAIGDHLRGIPISQSDAETLFPGTPGRKSAAGIRER
jgi:hypothetical protein